MKKIELIFLLIAFVALEKVMSRENQPLSQQSLTVPKPAVKLGVDVLVEKYVDLIKGKHVGLITNHTGVNNQLKPTIDVLFELPEVKLVALFGPEHGVRGDAEGGEYIEGSIDEKTGLPVYSLYGKIRQPTSEMLKAIDVLIYDIQDIGSRAYTYIYTMAYAMQAAKEAHIKFMVLDRPNPMGGEKIGGNVLDPAFSSFIGLYPIPYIYGMTVGELAQLFNKEFNINCDLAVIPMQGWQRQMLWQNCGLMWVPTSPHVPHAETVFFVTTTGCIGELGTVSVGVGYTTPFELIGAPWLDGEKLAAELKTQHLPGVYFRPLFFKPFYSAFAKEPCRGIQIHILDLKKFEPASVQIHLLTAIKKLYPKQELFEKKRISMFDKAFGTDQVRLKVQRGDSAESIMDDWGRQLEEFKKVRERYLIY